MTLTTDPVLNTLVFSVLFGLAILFSLRRRKDNQIFPISTTLELKGLAILFIIFSHIGYTLADDDRFLRPLSNLAGVGVAMFLLTSGYGLTASGLKRKLSVWQFYKKRLPKLYISFWIVLSVYFLLDFLALGKTYALDYVVHSFLGLFRTADAFVDVNSPLWYFSLILFYYLIFPIIFNKRFAWLSSIGLFVVGYWLVHHIPLETVPNVGLYKFYTAAFPLGVMIAWALSRPKVANFIKSLINRLNSSGLKIYYYATLLALPALFIFTRTFTGPGQISYKEQTFNIISILIVLIFFLIKRFDIKLFSLFGTFSFEIYLIHWPLMARYDVLFAHLPGWLAVTLYLPVFLALAWLLQKLSNLPARRVR